VNIKNNYYKCINNWNRKYLAQSEIAQQGLGVSKHGNLLVQIFF